MKNHTRQNLSETVFALSIVQSILNEHGFSIEARLVHQTLIFVLHFYNSERIREMEIRGSCLSLSNLTKRVRNKTKSQFCCALYIRINGAVNKLQRVLYQSLLLLTLV